MLKTLVMAVVSGPLMIAPAFAGAKYCVVDRESAYHVEAIPHGFAIVYANYADYCQPPFAPARDFEELDPLTHVCNYQADYRLGFKVDGDNLVMTFHDLETEQLKRCE